MNRHLLDAKALGDLALQFDVNKASASINPYLA